MLSTTKGSRGVGIAASYEEDESGKILGVPQIIYLDDDYEKRKNELVGDNIHVLPLKDPKIEREVIAAFGASGSGKSYQVMAYARLYRKLWKKDNDGAGRDIFLISKVEGDPTFKPIADIVHQIPLNVDQIDAIDIEDLEPCLFIFDDVDQIADKALSESVNRLLMSILEIGRHQKISCFITQHLVGTGTDLKRSRTILNETHRVIIFPAGTSAHATRYFLSKHVGVSDKREIERIRQLRSRWVCIHRRYPLYYIWQTGAAVIQ